MGQQVLVPHPRYSQRDRHFKLQAPSIPLIMASRREPVGTQRRLRSSAQQVRRSARLEGRKAEQASISSPVGKVSRGRIAPQRPRTLNKPSKLHQKRKRGQEAGHSSSRNQDRPPSKRPQTSPLGCTAKGEPKKVESDASKNVTDPPDVDFEAQGSELQELGGILSVPSNVESASQASQDDDPYGFGYNKWRVCSGDADSHNPSRKKWWINSSGEICFPSEPRR